MIKQIIPNNKNIIYCTKPVQKYFYAWTGMAPWRGDAIGRKMSVCIISEANNI